MADQKITELTALGATPDDADILPMVDDVAGTPTTKKVTVANLLAGAGGGTDMFGTATFTLSYVPNIDVTLVITVSGGEVTNSANGVQVSSTTTASRDANCARVRWDNVGYDQNMSILLLMQQLCISTNGKLYIYALANNYTADAATVYIGYRIEASAGVNTVYAVSKNATTEESTDVTATYVLNDNSNDFIVQMMILTAGVSAKLYQKGTLLATHTTNIPLNSDTTTDVVPWTITVNNADDSAASFVQLKGVNEQLTY